MSDRSIDEQLTKYLTDVHSIEVQALAQMKAAPDIAGDERLAAVFREHLDETREQERLVEQALETRGADSSALKDIAGRVGRWSTWRTGSAPRSARWRSAWPRTSTSPSRPRCARRTPTASRRSSSPI